MLGVEDQFFSSFFSFLVFCIGGVVVVVILCCFFGSLVVRCVGIARDVQSWVVCPAVILVLLFCRQAQSV
jgi:hypothetical protein